MPQQQRHRTAVRRRAATSARRRRPRAASRRRPCGEAHDVPQPPASALLASATAPRWSALPAGAAWGGVHQTPRGGVLAELHDDGGGGGARRARASAGEGGARRGGLGRRCCSRRRWPRGGGLCACGGPRDGGVGGACRGGTCPYFTTRTWREVTRGAGRPAAGRGRTAAEGGAAAAAAAASEAAAILTVRVAGVAVGAGVMATRLGGAVDTLVVTTRGALELGVGAERVAGVALGCTAAG